MVPSDQKRLDLALKGYRLATAEITYRRPDFRSLLQLSSGRTWISRPTFRC